VINKIRTTITVVAQSASPGMASIVRAALHNHCHVRMYMPREPEKYDNEHEVGMMGLGICEELEWISAEYPEEASCDILMFTWLHTHPYSSGQLALLRMLAARAKRVIMLYGSQFGSHASLLQAQGRFISREWRILRRLDLICYMLLPPRVDLFSPWVRRVPLSVGPNIHGLFEKPAQERLYGGVVISRPRPVRIFASGSDGGPGSSRMLIANSLKQQIGLADDAQFVTEIPEVCEERWVKVLWTVGSSKRLEYDAYIKALTQSDFTVCLPGTSWTHRPFEAVVRGSIPILDKTLMRMHDIPWKHGVNCLIVDRPEDAARWCVAVREAVAMNSGAVGIMRREVERLHSSHVSFDMYLKGLWRTLNK
jgi:hypothetical protein